MSFSTIQIQNRKQIEADKFIKILSKHMKAKGLVPATEEDSEFSFNLILSRNKNWIALSSPEYDEQNNA